jgi:GNAT superfamily N-acetyltransferase
LVLPVILTIGLYTIYIEASSYKDAVEKTIKEYNHLCRLNDTCVLHVRKGEECKKFYVKSNEINKELEDYMTKKKPVISIREVKSICGDRIQIMAIKGKLELVENGQLEDFDDIIEDVPAIIAVDEEGNDIGLIAFLISNSVLNINFSYVIPEKRRLGVFSLLWTRLLEKAKYNNIKIIQSYTHPDNKVMINAAISQGRKVVGLSRLIYKVDNVCNSKN